MPNIELIANVILFYPMSKVNMCCKSHEGDQGQKMSNNIVWYDIGIISWIVK